MLENFDFSLRFPSSKLPSISVNLMLTNLAATVALQRQLSDLMAMVDGKTDAATFSKEYEALTLRVGEGIRATLLAKYGE